jgi:hypothetical protein
MMPGGRTLKLEPLMFNKLLAQPQRFAPVVGSLMTPVALVGYVFAFWRLGADLNWLGEFFVAQGIFSRWQVWLAIAIVTQVAGRELDRLGRRKNTVAS